jgi:hypothetical protein
MSAKAKRGDDTWQLSKRLDAIINILLETTRVDGKPLPIASQGSWVSKKNNTSRSVNDTIILFSPRSAVCVVCCV